MRKSSLLIAIFISLTLWSASAYAQSIPAGSVWQNQRGSLFQINTVSANGLLTGFYVNKAAGYQCQNYGYPMTGWVVGTSVSFSVNWNNGVVNCNSTTGWTGYVSGNTLVTKWNLSASGSTTILSGADTFTRISAISHKGLVKK